MKHVAFLIRQRCWLQLASLVSYDNEERARAEKSMVSIHGALLTIKHVYYKAMYPHRHLVTRMHYKPAR